MDVDRYGYGAAYFVKWRFILGAIWRDLTNEERALFQSNSGVCTTLIVDDTPAFRNDLLVGDLIVKIDGTTVYGQQALTDMLEQKRGQEIELAILRKGQPIEKKIILAQ
jgi:C-terminal processing protease CtpA/Prc